MQLAPSSLALSTTRERGRSTGTRTTLAQHRAKLHKLGTWPPLIDLENGPHVNCSSAKQYQVDKSMSGLTFRAILPRGQR